MMMMASSLSSSTSTRDAQQAPKLTRRNSSFLGAIKNIVTAPLSWFSHADSEVGIAGNKRRRPESGPTPVLSSGLQEVPTEIIIEEQRSSSGEDEQDEVSRRSKRMKLSSPSRTIKAMSESKSTMRRSSMVPRASSAVLPSSRGASRATLSPKRHTNLYPSTIQRTMSIDPPHLASHRDTPSASFNFGVDVDMVGLDDISMPPSPSRLSPRPSFRMRSSMTPQPVQHALPQRHISEPPPLNALFSKPVFVHPPQEKEATPTPAPVPTLGTLVESTRNVRLPVKHQHASLLFSKPDEAETLKDVPAERALQQLDIYKTPLLPSRMRSDVDSITANVIPDIFKSRRASRPVLMSDDREKSGSKKNKGPVVNETKPYAGEGGMKKLLARAKLEAKKEKEKVDGGQSMNDTRGEATEPSSVPLAPPPPPVTSDWFKSAVSGASTSSSGSSLRVGRQKTSRNHIQRPPKSRFSAVYEDEGDDTMEDDERVKERRMLEEAAKKVPVFNIPSGFSFAKDTPAPLPSVDDLQKAKEPPIKTLPFSLSKSSTPSEVPKKDSSPKETQPTPAMPILEPPPVDPQTSLFSSEKSVSTFASSAASSSTNGTTVPNFFTTSQVLKEKSTVSNLNASSSTCGTAPTRANIFGIPPASTTVLEKPAAESNPFWEGNKEQTKSLPHTTSSPFPPIGRPEPTAIQSSVISPTPFTFGKSSEDKGPTIQALPSIRSSDVNPVVGSLPSEKIKEKDPPSLSFSFVKPSSASTATIKTGNGGASSLPFEFGRPAAVSEKPSATTSLPFSLVPKSERIEKKPEAVPMAPKPLFEPSTAGISTVGSATQSAASLFGELPKASFSSVPPPQSTPSPLPFTFGPLPSSGSASTSETVKPAFPFGSSAKPSSTSTALPSAVEISKPLFAPFSFAPEKKDPEKPSSFSFGATSNTPPVVPEVQPSTAPAPAPFTFASSSLSAPVAAAPPIAFTFSGGGSAGTDVTTKSPFFGVSSGNVVHTERPVTPPKIHDQEVRMEESPVREMQVNGKALEALPPFSFGSANSNGINDSTLFGGMSSGSTANSTTTTFTFGASSTTSNPFGNKQPEESKPFGGFGAPQAPPINTSFSFGKDESRPPSAFTFGQTPTSATNSTPAFSFGASTNTSPNPFTAATSSAPASPSTFAQQAPFTFGATTSGFTFGSQPSSPASGASLTLPQSTFGSGTGFGQTPSPASPFSVPLPLAQSTSSGGTLFTIGAAPAPPVGQRQIKKLPRRGNVKR